MKLYIAGPMTGLEGYNTPAFNEAEETLKDAGYEVSNPAELSDREEWEWQHFVRAGLLNLAECDGVALLDGWENSPGALIEETVAHLLDLPVKYVDLWLNPKINCWLVDVVKGMAIHFKDQFDTHPGVLEVSEELSEMLKEWPLHKLNPVLAGIDSIVPRIYFKDPDDGRVGLPRLSIELRGRSWDQLTGEYTVHSIFQEFTKIDVKNWEAEA